MEDLFSLLKAVRKIEVLILPFFPSRWRDPPPSYRIIVPLLEKLKRYKERFPWMDALVYSLQKRGYEAYHEEGLSVVQMTPSEMKLVRFILSIVVLVIISAFTGYAQLMSPWIKASLFFGSCLLLLYGAKNLSISALWAAWGLLFVPFAMPLVVAGPWVPILIGVLVLLWHIPGLNRVDSWRWFHVLATLPFLFFWAQMLHKLIPKWTHWQTGLLYFTLWFSIWTILFRFGNRPLISRTLQLFWPASLLGVVSLLGKGLLLDQLDVHGIARLISWILCTLLTSLLAAIWYRRIASWTFLFRLRTMAVIFGAFAAMLFFQESLTEVDGTLNISLGLVSDWLWPIWWLVGAGLVMAVRSVSIVLLRWIQALFRSWTMFLAVGSLSCAAFALGWLSPLIHETGKVFVVGALIVFSMGATVLALKKKEPILNEWLFWGFYLCFLFEQYISETHRTVETFYSKTEMGIKGFLFLAVWLLWLSYQGAGDYLRKLKEQGMDQKYGISSVTLMGGFLWILTAMLWLSYLGEGDQQISIRSKINYELFMGFTYIGVPLIVYRLIAPKYLSSRTSQKIPLHYPFLMGIGLVQILLGVEHVVVAIASHQPLDALLEKLHFAVLNKIPLEQVMPPWFMNPSWLYPWRLARWLIAMIALMWAMGRNKQNQWFKPIVIFTACLTSISVATAETYWMVWPGLGYGWAGLFHPDVRTSLMWSMDFLIKYVSYIVGGVVWGWLLCGWIPCESLGPKQGE